MVFFDANETRNSQECKKLIRTFFQSVAIERESQLKEMMKIMGLSSTMHWVAWFIKVFISLLISFTFVTLFLCVRTFSSTAIFDGSNFFLIWVFFIVYITSVITFCFLISVIFKKSNTAANIGTMIFFATVIPYNQFTLNFESFHYVTKLLFCLPVNTGFGEAISIVLRFERDVGGLQFSNFFSRGTTGFSFAEVMMVMIVAIFIHIGLTIYVENVFPGSIGVAKPWHYPFTWCRKSRSNDKPINIYTNLELSQISNEDHEADPSNLSPGIQIRNLSKTFGQQTVVKNLSLNMYEDQITVLLGHNGSGKTTTMSILSGMIPPTSGTAIVNGFDVTTDIEKARESLGLCPQHNVLFNDLTIKEHIIFFSRLKGMRNESEINEEVTKYVNALNLQDKINARSKTLSGGTKRKLNAINALCGHSKIVICDEPSSGVDVGARRDLWDLLIQEKKGRTILLTTHHMDEAETLGDRVAVLNEGQLQTVGSTYFLKKRFGSGYRLTCVKKVGCDAKVILEVLIEFSRDAMLVSDDQTEVVFALPESDVQTFQYIFKKLEDDAERLKISSFGCSITSLEDVFLKLGADADDKVGNQDHEVDLNLDQSKAVTGFTLVLYQIWAMTLKQFNYMRRNYYMFIWMTLLSAWLIFVFMASPVGPFEGQPPMDVNPLNLFMVLFMLYFLVCYWPSIFINMKIKERVTRSKLLQYVCGANRFIFWITSFLIDFIVFATVMCIIVGVLALYQRENFTTGTELGSLILILTFYGFSILPFVYLFSFLFKKHATGEAIVPMWIFLCE